MRYGSAIWFLLSSFGYIRKNVEPFLSLVSRVKAFALPLLAETSNDQSPTPMWLYRSPSWLRTQKCPKPMRAVYNTPHEASSLLCFWQEVESLRSSNTSKPKRQITPVVCMPSACPPQMGFRHKDNAKLRNLIDITKFFARKVYDKSIFSLKRCFRCNKSGICFVLRLIFVRI